MANTGQMSTVTINGQAYRSDSLRGPSLTIAEVTRANGRPLSQTGRAKGWRRRNTGLKAARDEQIAALLAVDPCCHWCRCTISAEKPVGRGSGKHYAKLRARGYLTCSRPECDRADATNQGVADNAENLPVFTRFKSA